LAEEEDEENKLVSLSLSPHLLLFRACCRLGEEEEHGPYACEQHSEQGGEHRGLRRG